MIIERAMALTCWAWFFREGKAVTAGGVCSDAAVPDVGDAGWVTLGRIETWSHKLADNTIDVKGPTTAAPGVISRIGRIRTEQMLDYEFTSSEMTAQAMGLAHRAADELTSATESFVPLGGTPPLGWLKLQQYTNRNESFASFNLWGELSAELPEGGGREIIKPKFNFALIYSAQNLVQGATE
jgi:hypothetical protein